MSPLIVRRSGPPSSASAVMMSGAAFHPQAAFDPEDREELIDQVKLFATGWFGGLVFFGTYLG